MILPLFLFYGIAILGFGLGVVACVGAFRSRYRRRWVLGAGITAIVMGLGMNISYQNVIWSPLSYWASFKTLGQMVWQLSWVVALGLAPIILGAISLIRWFRLRK